MFFNQCEEASEFRGELLVAIITCKVMSLILFGINFKEVFCGWWVSC